MTSSSLALSSLVLLLMVVLVTPRPQQKRVINGVEAHPHSRPYSVYIKQITRRTPDGTIKIDKCGGALIDKSWVLTAAHCVSKFNKWRNVELELILGDHNDRKYDEGQVKRFGVNVFIHPEFNDFSDKVVPGDIALVKLGSPVQLSDTVKVASFASSDADYKGTRCIQAGWGYTNSREKTSPTVLQEHYLTVTHNRLCNIYDTFTNHMLCVISDQSKPDTATCSGDSGSPLMCGRHLDVIVGLVSGQGTECETNLPMMFARVATYSGWINNIMNWN